MIKAKSQCQLNIAHQDQYQFYLLTNHAVNLIQYKHIYTTAGSYVSLKNTQICPMITQLIPNKNAASYSLRIQQIFSSILLLNTTAFDSKCDIHSVI